MDRNPSIVGTKRRTSILSAENHHLWSLVSNCRRKSIFLILKIYIHIQCRSFHSSCLASQSRIRSWHCPKPERSDIRSCQLRSSWKLFRAIQRKRATRWVRKIIYSVTTSHANYLLSCGKRHFFLWNWWFWTNAECMERKKVYGHVFWNDQMMSFEQGTSRVFIKMSKWFNFPYIWCSSLKLSMFPFYGPESFRFPSPEIFIYFQLILFYNNF